jgi:thymidylate synthase
MKDGDQDIKEALHCVLTVKKPELNDKIISKYGDKLMIDWMLSNFLEQKKVPELKNGLSYGTRLFNYNGKNQVEWVVNKLKEKSDTKAATIPLIMPNEDEGYIPCVSLLDFKIRNNKLMLAAMCRSIDCGKKVYANLIALHKIQQIVSEKIKVPTGELIMYVVSAHIYMDDYAKIEQILQEVKNE